MHIAKRIAFVLFVVVLTALSAVVAYAAPLIPDNIAWC